MNCRAKPRREGGAGRDHHHPPQGAKGEKRNPQAAGAVGAMIKNRSAWLKKEEKKNDAIDPA